jgi:hypothetical protein
MVSQVWWIKLQGALSLSEYFSKTHEMAFLYREDVFQKVRRLHR